MFLRERGHLSLQEKGGIVALLGRGVPVCEIAETIDCHPTTVRRWRTRYARTFDVKRQIGSGRPKKTTPEEDSRLLDSVRAKPITTAQEIAGK